MRFSQIATRIRPEYYPGVAVIIAIAALLGFWLIVPGGSFNQNENADYVQFYLPVAQNIAHGNGITLDGKLALDYPPGYPVILAASFLLANVTGMSEDLVMHLSIVLFFALGALLIYFLARKLWDPSGALLASILWSCYPIVLWAARNPNTELPFSVVLYAALACMIAGWFSPKRSVIFFLLAGILCGIAMLIRPIAIGLGVLLAVITLFGSLHTLRKKVILSLCLIAGNLVAIMPWELWIYSQTNQITPLCRGRDSYSMFDGLTFAVFNPPGSERKGVAVPQDVKMLMTDIVDKYAVKAQTQAISSKDLALVMINKGIKQPITTLKLISIKIMRSWYATNTNRFETPILLIQLLYAILLLWAAVLLWRKRQELRWMLIVGGVLTCYFWGMTVIVLSIVRYMMPIFGVLLIFFPAILIKPSSPKEMTPH